MSSLLSKLMKNFVNEVKFFIKFFYLEYISFVLHYYFSTKSQRNNRKWLFFCDSADDDKWYRTPRGTARRVRKFAAFAANLTSNEKLFTPIMLRLF